MKKLWKMLLLAGVFTVLLCGSALAEDITAGGFYNIGTATDVKVEPKAFSGEVTKTSAEVDSTKTGYETFYANSDKLTVTYTGTVAEGDQFVVMLVTGEGLPTTANTICYIDQKAGSAGSVTFDVYPMLPTTTTKMTLYITSDREGFGKIEVPLNYAVRGTYAVAPYTLGDVNIVNGVVGDGAINATDASFVLQASVNLYTLSETQQLAADVNKDGAANASDASYILQYSVSLIKDFTSVQK